MQIKAHILFKADIENSGIKVRIFNFEEDSVVNLDFAYDEIDDERLDRLGNFILRRINDFSKRHTLTENEHEALRASLKEARRREKHGLPRLSKRERERAAGDASGLLERLRETLFGARTRK